MMSMPIVQHARRMNEKSGEKNGDSDEILRFFVINAMYFLFERDLEFFEYLDQGHAEHEPCHALHAVCGDVDGRGSESV